MDEKTLNELNANPATLYIGADLGSAEWKLAATTRTSSNQKVMETSIDAFDFQAMGQWVHELRARLELGVTSPVVVCYEAGRDGFSVYRALEEWGAVCLVVDPASIEVNVRKRRAKTDRLDARLLLRKLRAYMTDRDVFQVVRVPSEEVEDLRRPSREYDRLVHERTQHRTRINSLLALHGIVLPIDGRFVELLRGARTRTGQPLRGHLKAELLREMERLELVQHQLDELQKELARSAAAPQTTADEQGAKLRKLVAIGPVTAMTLPREFFWRDFHNRGEVGAAAGLTGTPHVTGTSTDIEQGISKAGNKRVRTLMIEIAWSWVKHQPDSAITQWYRAREDGTKRTRRKSIVAVARQLLIALWRYVTQDITPKGARLRVTPD